MTSGPLHKAGSFRIDPNCTGCCTRLSNFSVAFGAGEVLRNINLHIHCGELTAICGPNGAGKSTLLRAMLGEVPSKGELTYTKADTDIPMAKPRMGYVPQRLFIDRTAPVTVEDLLTGANFRWPLWFPPLKKFEIDIEKMLERVDGKDLLRKKVGQLSCGQLQRVLLALALDPLPDLLLLDEPVAGVDRAGIELFYETVSRLRLSYDLSIIMVSHDLLEVAKVADRIIYLNKEIVFDGRPEEFLSQSQLCGPLDRESPLGPASRI